MYRIGQSTDIHALVAERKLILGGVEIPHELGLLGHSDADALLHAISEAILGALALGDLGKHFPDTEERYKGVSSLYILNEVAKKMNEYNYEIGNIDALIMIERPKMAPHIQKMVTNVANALECDYNKVNIKATRGEKLGFVGEEKGVQAQAVVLLKRKEG